MARASANRFAEQRAAMVEDQLTARGISDERVLAAMRKVPRHEFIPENLWDHAYADRPLPIGFDQTISQPYVVAFMIQELRLPEKAKVLEIGTGSGYQTALLSEIGHDVYSIEIDERLYRRAVECLKRLGYGHVHLWCGDGCAGWPEKVWFAGILLSAATSEIPRRLLNQLEMHGRMIFPFGDEDQQLVVLQKTPRGLTSEELGGVRFVRMTSGM